MIDLHCHLLPAVDDGPETMEEALDLARLSVADGITHAVVTPHVHPGRYENTLDSLQQPLQAFQLALQDAGIPLELRLGGEIRVSLEALDLLLAGNAPFLGTLNGYRVALFEFPHQSIPAGSTQFLRKMLDMKIRPLIAHPERNKSIMENPDRLRPYVEMGCLLQLTASSVTGYFGKTAQKVAMDILDDDDAWVVASDAHNAAHRPPLMRACHRLLSEQFGEDVAAMLTRDRAARLLAL